MTLAVGVRWASACRIGDLQPERGVAALFGDTQVALFRLYDGTVHAIGNRDPVSGAHVLSRGIVGTRAEVPVVVSPMHKQAFDLRTGECLDLPGIRVPVYEVRLRDDVVEVALSRC
jgi:nitrite reductase (NADH) small subunit